MDDDFTFPTVPVPPAPAPAPEERQDHLDVAPLPGRLPDPTTSPLWPFSSSPKTKSTTTTTADGDEEDAPSTSTSTRIGAHAEAVRQHDDEDRMDLLWEDFNDDMEPPRPRQRPDSSDDAESEEASGCAPASMLRASSRAGGAGHFCGSSRGGRRTTGWTLLLRLFHRLFAVDKRPPSLSPRRRHQHGVYVP